MDTPILTEPVALSLIRSLSGAEGYPFHYEGEMRYAKVLSGCCVGYSHALAVVEEFETGFPSIEQIRNVAWRLKPQFDPKCRLAPQFDPADRVPPGWSRDLLVGLESKSYMAEYDEMCRAIMRRLTETLGVKDTSFVTEEQWLQAKKDLGYPMHPLQEKILRGEQP